MRRYLISAIVGFGTLLASSCTNYYDEQPEGYVTQSVPAGYTLAVVAGLSYYHYNNHYYRYWPGYGYVVVRPPYGRPPYQRPPQRPPSGRPPGKPGKPEHPIERPPGNRPPGGKPPTIQPTPYPVTRPGGPSTRPSAPSSRPSIQPVQRPGGGGFGGGGGGGLGGGGGRTRR